MMNLLSLSPFPSLRTSDESGNLLMEREGFVDEAVVTALLRAPYGVRSVAVPTDLALAADDSDFAGWQLPTAFTPSPFTSRMGAVEAAPALAATPTRRAAPPMIEEPGIGTPHYGAHRWWLAGLAGVLSTMLFSVLLLALSSRSTHFEETVLSPRKLTTPVAAPRQLARSLETPPELTDASPYQP